MIKLIAGLLLTDVVATLFLLLYVRKTGAIHLFLSTLHKFLFLSLVTVAVLKTGETNIYIKLFYVSVILLLFEQAFEVNDYLFKMFDPARFDLENLSPEARQLIEAVIEDFKYQNEKTLITRIRDMLHNFSVNFGQDLGVIFMLVTNNKSMKKSYVEIHAMMGNNIAFRNMSFMDLLFMLRNRVVVDAVVLIFLVVSL